MLHRMAAVYRRTPGFARPTLARLTCSPACCMAMLARVVQLLCVQRHLQEEGDSGQAQPHALAHLAR